MNIAPAEYEVLAPWRAAWPQALAAWSRFTRLQEPLFLLLICGAFYFIISFPIARFGGYLEKRWSND